MKYILLILILVSCKATDNSGVRRGYVAIDTTYIIDGTRIETIKYIKK